MVGFTIKECESPGMSLFIKQLFYEKVDWLLPTYNVGIAGK